MEYKIGTDAGLVWEALKKSNKTLDVKALKKVTGIKTEKEVYMAIGWLAKEDKLNFAGEDTKNIKVSLK